MIRSASDPGRKKVKAALPASTPHQWPFKLFIVEFGNKMSSQIKNMLTERMQAQLGTDSVAASVPEAHFLVLDASLLSLYLPKQEYRQKDLRALETTPKITVQYLRMVLDKTKPGESCCFCLYLIIV
jgi:hypothetical protein